MIVMLHPGFRGISRGPLMSPTGLKLSMGHVSSMSQRPSFLVSEDFGFKCLEKVP